jgi:hypothetical protein
MLQEQHLPGVLSAISKKPTIKIKLIQKLLYSSVIRSIFLNKGNNEDIFAIRLTKQGAALVLIAILFNFNTMNMLTFPWFIN